MNLSICIDELLDNHPRLSLAPSKGEFIAIKGRIDVNHTHNNTNLIQETYDVLIQVPIDFPKSVPVIFETGNKIPKTIDNHVNKDGTLCLGSPLRLQLFLEKNPSLLNFIESFLIPHLYAVSNKLKGGNFIFGELEHGFPGELADYEEIFGVKGIVAIQNILNSLSCFKKRVANKKVCPCGCGRRLGVCKVHFKLNSIRRGCSRNSFKKILMQFNKRLAQQKIIDG